MKHKFTASLTAFAAAAAMMLTAAADTPVNGISASENTLSAGDAFTITLYCPPAENADTASIKAVFDSSAFEVTDWDVSLPGGVSNHSEGIFAVSAANIAREIDLSGGLTLTAEMAVKPGAAPGSYTVTLDEYSLCWYNEDTYDFVELWEPVSTSVVLTVKGGDDTAAAPAEQDTAPAEPDVPTETGPAQDITPIFIISGAAVLLIILCIIAAKFGIARKK